MSWFGKLFGGAPQVDGSHPPLPAGVDQFLPKGGLSGFRASVNASGEHLRTGAIVFRAGAGTSRISQADAR